MSMGYHCSLWVRLHKLWTIPVLTCNDVHPRFNRPTKLLQRSSVHRLYSIREIGLVRHQRKLVYNIIPEKIKSHFLKKSSSVYWNINRRFNAEHLQLIRPIIHIVYDNHMTSFTFTYLREPVIVHYTDFEFSWFLTHVQSV